MRPTDSTRTWKAFYDSARFNDVLEQRTTVMLHLAVAMAVGCDP